MILMILFTFGFHPVCCRRFNGLFRRHRESQPNRPSEGLPRLEGCRHLQAGHSASATDPQDQAERDCRGAGEPPGDRRRAMTHRMLKTAFPGLVIVDTFAQVARPAGELP